MVDKLERAREHLERLLTNRELRARLHKLCEEAGMPISRQALSDWRTLTGVPPQRVRFVSKVLRVPPSEIRPDLPHLFPPRRKRGDNGD